MYVAFHPSPDGSNWRRRRRMRARQNHLDLALFEILHEHGRRVKHTQLGGCLAQVLAYIARF
jgi:hypothetical protein